MLDGFSIGGELAFTGSQYFDGDPSNLNAKLPSTVVVNLRAAWQIDALGSCSARWTICSTIATRCTAPISIRPDTAGLVTPALSDPRTLTLRQPGQLPARG